MSKFLVTALLAALVVLAGCGEEERQPASGGDGGSQRAELRTVYTQDPTGGLDPDAFYDIEGESTILSVYEGLLRYKEGTSQLEPSLARSYAVSSDGRTYTFALRPGVVFHDGTPLDAGAVVGAFERRTALEGGPSYVLEPVASVRASDATTVVVRLKAPNAAFPHFLASMYGPKVISPKALRDHAGDDDAARWLRNHAVGTGPYRLASYTVGQRITLERFDRYWGPKANTRGVQIAIVPNVGDQVLRLRSGQLDVIPHGITASQLRSLRGNDDLAVTTPDALIRPVLGFNVSRPPFDDRDARRAVLGALDIKGAVQQIYGDVARPAAEFIPPALLPSATNPLRKPEAGSGSRPSAPITLGYNQAETDNRLLAEFFQRQLEEAGYEVRLQGDSGGDQFAYAGDLKAAPELAITTLNPDAAHPEAWMRSIYGTGGGLNLLGYSNPQLDRQLDRAVSESDPAQAQKLYAQAAQTAQDDAATWPLADVRDTIVSRKDVAGFGHVPAYIWVVNFAKVKAG